MLITRIAESSWLLSYLSWAGSAPVHDLSTRGVPHSECANICGNLSKWLTWEGSDSVAESVKMGYGHGQVWYGDNREQYRLISMNSKVLESLSVSVSSASASSSSSSSRRFLSPAALVAESAETCTVIFNNSTKCKKGRRCTMADSITNMKDHYDFGTQKELLFADMNLVESGFKDFSQELYRIGKGFQIEKIPAHRSMFVDSQVLCGLNLPTPERPFEYVYIDVPGQIERLLWISTVTIFLLIGSCSGSYSSKRNRTIKTQSSYQEQYST